MPPGPSHIPNSGERTALQKLRAIPGLTLAKLHPRDEDEEAGEEVGHHNFRSGSGRGTIFLVDAKSRHVIWSDYERPGRSASDDHLNRAAGRIVKKMAGSLGK